ncbi:MAG: non-ribosomal peptide synthetase, partial [bacterium]|nr:non-ribosomal peptide synthetase [bacterium]
AAGKRAAPAQPTRPPEIPVRDRSLHDGPGATRTLPLSFSQERLWLLDRLEPGATAYNLPCSSRLVGRLDPAMLERCLAEIVRRHESLRTTFASRDGRPVQIVAPTSTFRLPVVDLSRLTEPERHVQVETLLHADLSTPFDLARGPLYRASLLRLDPAHHVLLQNMHHIISDGWSIRVLFRELATLLEGRQPPEPPIQYPDFSLWQRERLRGEVLEEQLAYWTRQLEGPLPTLQLPADRQRPTLQTYRGARLDHRLAAPLTRGLHGLSQDRGVTLFMTLLATFKLLLHRYTGQDDVIVGSPVAGRRRLETEGLIGFFLNTLVLRTRLSPALPLAELLERVRRTVLGATAHQDLP